MKPEVLLELLESTAEQLNIKVTYESLQSRKRFRCQSIGRD